MTSKDLMIGDWVKNDLGEIQQVVEIHDGEKIMLAYNDFYSADELEPIPLTAEILEKNGFVKRYNYQWEYRDNSCKIEISIAPQIEIDGEMLGAPPINVIFEGALFDINMTSDDICVHNLQHIIRLCGIEKEITL